MPWSGESRVSGHATEDERRSLPDVDQADVVVDCARTTIVAFLGVAIVRQNGKLRGKQPVLKPAQDREIRRMHDTRWPPTRPRLGRQARGSGEPPAMPI
jgi:hypothetical protein